MCEFCKNVGNEYEDIELMQSKDLYVQSGVKIAVASMLIENDSMNEGLPSITVDLDLPTSSGPFFTIRKAIKYCPNCGRKLI